MSKLKAERLDQGMGVHCPQCNNIGSICMDSRPGSIGQQRRRKCKSCLARFSTVEVSTNIISAMLQYQEFAKSFAIKAQELATMDVPDLASILTGIKVNGDAV